MSDADDFAVPMMASEAAEAVRTTTAIAVMMCRTGRHRRSNPGGSRQLPQENANDREPFLLE